MTQLLNMNQLFNMTHFLNTTWQGAALTAVIWILLKLLPRLSSATRYAVWWITMLAVVALPLATLLPSALSDSTPSASSAAPMPRIVLMPTPAHDTTTTALLISKPDQNPDFSAPQQPSHADSLSLRLPSHFVTTLLLVLWLFVSAALFARLGYSWQALMRLKRFAVEPPHNLQTRFQHIATRVSFRRKAHLLVSHEITTPLALGFFDPAVLIPASLAQDCPSDEFDHLCLHELAHIARFDDWANLLQQVLIALMPIQPALFWISRHLDTEREAACDDRVIFTAPSPKPYAASLTRIAELALWSRSAILATGVASSRSQLYCRIHRLLDRRISKKTSVSPIPFLAAIAIIIGLAFLSLCAPPLIALADSPAPPAQSNNTAQPPNPALPPIPEMPPENLPPISGTQTKSIPAQPGETLSVDTDFGNIAVTSWDQNSVQFKVTQKGPDISNMLRHHHIAIGRHNHEVSLSASQDGSLTRFDGNIEYEITVPKQFDVKIKNHAGNTRLADLNGKLSADIDNGNIDATACAGNLDLSTQAGNVNLRESTASAQIVVDAGNINADDCQSPLNLQTHAGNVDLANCTADTVATSDAGNVVAKSISGPIDAGSKMGNVEVRQFSGPSLQAHSNMGNVDADVEAALKSDSSVTTNMGNVSLNLASTAAVTLKFSSALGNVSSDYRAGPLNGGGPKLEASTRMGNVNIHRK
jgi:beta-lactamase regulating signal transducer with metallopeptidase domain/DUF4097 and DUF4098 domain-containing protein YvlB